MQGILPSFDLKYLLENSTYGMKILKYYHQYKILDDTNRRQLVDTLIKHLYKYILAHRLKHDQYVLLCDKITALFPNESSSTYYVPYVPKKKTGTGKGILAKGRLVDKVKNLLHQCGATATHKSKRKLDDILHEEPSTSAGVELDENDQEDISFLQHYTEPWEEVISKWKDTAKWRKQSEKRTVQEFINKWPIVKDIRAEQLINIDFEINYGKFQFNLLSNWSKFIDTIFKISDISKIRDKDLVSYYSLFCNTEDALIDSKVFCEIQLLCHLIPPKGRIKISKQGSIKFSIIESIESIVIRVDNASDIESRIKLQREKEISRQQPVQPYLLVVGENLQSVQTVFVIVDTIKYQFNTLIRGLDFLFKVFHVFNAKYPLQSEHIWTLIQQGLFKINTKRDKTFPYISHLLKALRDH